jgi:hypothetical protein
LAKEKPGFYGKNPQFFIAGICKKHVFIYNPIARKTLVTYK